MGPAAERVAVRVAGADHPLADAGWGVREAVVAGGVGGRRLLVRARRHAVARPGDALAARGDARPVARLDLGAFPWSDGAWTPPAMADLVIYELHVRVFSADGTFDGAIGHLAVVAALGVNAIELLPVADGPGLRGWGYDGVLPERRAPRLRRAGELAELVDAAHSLGLAVILDVVYNTSARRATRPTRPNGPYFTDRYSTFWGEAINYDVDHGADGVREWVLQSAEGWIRDFHVDGLRLDAIHAIYDTSARHIVQELTERVHAASRTHPPAIVIAESGLNDPKVMEPVTRNGFGCDSAWADDFHHAMRVLLTGEREGYYADFGDMASWPRPGGRRTSTTGPGRRSAAACSARRATTSRPRRSSSSARTTTRSATAPSATACRPSAASWPRSATSSPRSCPCCSWARSTARTRRSSSSPTHRRGDRHRHP